MSRKAPCVSYSIVGKGLEMKEMMLRQKSLGTIADASK
jgi:hypothetical protein